MRVASLFISACLFLSQSAVQTATPVQRDPQAVALLQTSVQAMGGTAPTASLAMGDIVTVAGSLNSTGTIRILTRGTDQTSEQIQTSSSFTRVYSRGRASITTGGSLSTLPMESAVTTQSSCFPLPFLSAALANPDTAFKYIGLETLNGSSVQHIQFWNTFASIPDLQPLANLSHRDIWVDATSGLPQRVSFASRSSDRSGSSVPVDVLLSDYRNTNGILYPFSIQVSVNGTPWATISIQNVTLNSGLDDSSFLVQ